MNIKEVEHEIIKRLEPAAKIMVERGLIGKLEELPRFFVDEKDCFAYKNVFTAHIVENGDIDIILLREDGFPFTFSFNRYYMLTPKTAEYNLRTFIGLDEFESISRMKDDDFEDYISDITDEVINYIEEQIKMVIDKASKYL